MYCAFIIAAEVKLISDKDTLDRRNSRGIAGNWVYKFFILRFTRYNRPSIIASFFYNIDFIIFIRSYIAYVKLLCFGMES